MRAVTLSILSLASSKFGSSLDFLVLGALAVEQDCDLVLVVVNLYTCGRFDLSNIVTLRLSRGFLYCIFITLR